MRQLTWQASSANTLPRPRVYMVERLFAASPDPASAARLNQSAAAGESGAVTPFPSSSKVPSSNIARGNPATAPLVYHFMACSGSFLAMWIPPSSCMAYTCSCPAAFSRSAVPSSAQGLCRK